MHMIGSPYSSLTAMRKRPEKRCKQHQSYQLQTSQPVSKKQGRVSKKFYDDTLKTTGLIMPKTCE